MANMTTLKRRIGSVQNTRQITRAMQLVAASKLRRAQEQAMASRAYREAAYGLLARLSESVEINRMPLFSKRPVKTKLYVILTSNNGLAGAYNANVIKRLLAALGSDRQAHIGSQVIVVGSQGAQVLRRLEGVELLAYYPFFGDRPSQHDIQPLLVTITKQYIEKRVDEIRVLYTLSRSSIKQEVVDLALLPAQFDTGGNAVVTPYALNFEPDAEAVVTSVASRLLEIQLWQAVLESLASEHAMRMVAMKHATDNASTLITDYILEYNTARQSSITQAIAEITGGAEALKD